MTLHPQGDHVTGGGTFKRWDLLGTCLQKKLIECSLDPRYFWRVCVVTKRGCTLGPYLMQSVSSSAFLACGVEAKRSLTRGRTDVLPNYRFSVPKTES